MVSVFEGYEGADMRDMRRTWRTTSRLMGRTSRSTTKVLWERREDQAADIILMDVPIYFGPNLDAPSTGLLLVKMKSVHVSIEYVSSNYS